ncbi:MalY/PatB family protein [Methylococcus sp. EFPC2]|uniref:MalY/PatB family protein n=1 Tax=Methylococcus sp. EFPC2 TaxID=2812648 RepID=UPI0019671CB3|nr:PatB family C-S lyase [Methylococcus sp. EFPC2]QSA95849.1 PatB family C-S lyase [Methylococcus sp. EFPC2]
MSFDFDTPIPREGTDTSKYGARQAIFGTEDVIPLWVADMDFAAPGYVTAAVKARAEHPIYGYTEYPPRLADSLIAWLRGRHGWVVEREWIVYTPGVVTGLFAAATAYAQAGEGVIVQSPVYHPFFSAVTVTGRKLLLNPLIRVGERYRFDLESLEQLAAQGARVLFLCSPHNPVGRVWTRDELSEVLAIARRYGLTVLSDEIWADLVYPGHKHTPLGLLAGENDAVITAVAPSKTFNIPGLGLSAFIVPDAGRRAAFVHTLESLHVEARNPFGIAAFEAAYSGGTDWLDALLAYLAGNRDFVVDYLARHVPAIKVVPPEGTYLLWLDCRELGMNDASLKRFFIEQARVGLSPGVLFGAAGSGYMRLNIGAPRATIAEALERIARALHGR